MKSREKHIIKRMYHSQLCIIIIIIIIIIKNVKIRVTLS